MAKGTDQLIEEIRQLIETQGVTQAALARAIEISPQGFWNALNGKSQFTGPQVLALQGFLRTKTHMDNDRYPRTLHLAREHIDALNSEISRLKRTPISTASTAPVTAAPTPTAKTPLHPMVADRNIGMHFNEPRMQADSPPVAPGSGHATFHPNPKTRAKPLYKFNGVNLTPWQIGEQVKILPTPLLAEAVQNTDNSAISRNIAYLALKERRELGDKQ